MTFRAAAGGAAARAFPSVVQLDERHAPSEPVDVGDFARWAASASLDGALAANLPLGWRGPSALC